MPNIVTPERDVEAAAIASASGANQFGLAFVVTGLVVAVLLALTLALWAAVGTTVFFEMMRAGFVACFG